MINHVDIDLLSTLVSVLEARPLVANHRVGAIVARNSKIISFGLSSYKTHPLQKKFAKNPKAIHLHAEVDAIKNALRKARVEKLSKYTIYVARIKKDGTIATAKPCKGCARAIAHFGLKRVVYTTSNGGVVERC